MKLKADRNIYLFSGIVLHRICLDINYLYIISKEFAYQGWYVNTGGFFNYVISFIVLFLSIPFAIKIYRLPQVFLSHAIFLLYLLSFVPGTSLIAFMPMSITFLTLYLTYWLSLLFFSSRQTTSMTVKYFAAPDRKIILYLLLILLSLTTLYISWRYTGFRMNFSLLNIYDLRMEARNYNMPIILSYLQGIGKSVLPVMFVYFILQKNKLLSVGIAFVIFINFSINGLKSTIFYLFVAIIGYYLFKGRNSIRWYVWGLILISIAGIVEYAKFESIEISSMIVRRVEFVPAILNYQYYDFFSNHEYDFFRQSFLRNLGFQSPYKTDISFIIGAQMGNSGMRANNGLFSDAYANFGVTGIICFPFLLVLFIRLMNAYAIKINEKLLLIPVIVTVIPLISTAFMTCLVTHGLIGILICMMAMGKKNIKKKNYLHLANDYAYQTGYNQVIKETNKNL